MASCVGPNIELVGVNSGISGRELDDPKLSEMGVIDETMPEVLQ